MKITFMGMISGMLIGVSTLLTTKYLVFSIGIIIGFIFLYITLQEEKKNGNN